MTLVEIAARYADRAGRRDRRAARRRSAAGRGDGHAGGGRGPPARRTTVPQLQLRDRRRGDRHRGPRRLPDDDGLGQRTHARDRRVSRPRLPAPRHAPDPDRGGRREPRRRRPRLSRRHGRRRTRSCRRSRSAARGVAAAPPHRRRRAGPGHRRARLPLPGIARQQDGPDRSVAGAVPGQTGDTADQIREASTNDGARRLGRAHDQRHTRHVTVHRDPRADQDVQRRRRAGPRPARRSTSPLPKAPSWA